jgi:hypothetical protein
MNDEGDIPSIQCNMSLRGSKSVRKIDRLSPRSQSESELLKTGGLPPISSSWRQASWDSRREITFNWTFVVVVLL